MGTNEFKKEDSTRIWIDHPYSIWSGKNSSGGDSLARHHILGRSGEYLNSMFNCALILNYTENINKHGELNTEEVRTELLQKVARHIFGIVAQGGYTLTETDKLFLHKYKEYYG